MCLQVKQWCDGQCGVLVLRLCGKTLQHFSLSLSLCFALISLFLFFALFFFLFFPLLFSRQGLAVMIRSVEWAELRTYFVFHWDSVCLNIYTTRTMRWSHLKRLTKYNYNWSEENIFSTAHVDINITVKWYHPRRDLRTWHRPWLDWTGLNVRRSDVNDLISPSLDWPSSTCLTG